MQHMINGPKSSACIYDKLKYEVAKSSSLLTYSKHQIIHMPLMSLEAIIIMKLLHSTSNEFKFLSDEVSFKCTNYYRTHVTHCQEANCSCSPLLDKYPKLSVVSALFCPSHSSPLCLMHPPTPLPHIISIGYNNFSLFGTVQIL